MKNYFSLIILISALFAQNEVAESDSLNPITLEGVEVYSSLRSVNEGDLAASEVDVYILRATLSENFVHDEFCIISKLYILFLK